VGVPALLITGSDDCVTPTAQHGGPIHAALGSGCRDLVELEGASHCQFAASDFYCNLGEAICPPPALTRAQQQSAAGSLMAPWLDAQTGAAAAWNTYLDARAAVDADVLSHCPEPPALVMGPLSILPDPGAARLSWNPVPSATAYRVEGATPVDWPAFQPLVQVPDTSWTPDAQQPWRVFRVRALR